MTDQPRKILFFILHAGFLRSYAAPIRELVQRGHEVTLSFTRVEKDAGDASLVHRLVAECPSVRYEVAPERSRYDMWRGIAWLDRAFADVARYTHPRYANAPALRDRMARKLVGHVRTSKGLDPVSGALCSAIVGWMQRHSGERLSRRLVSLFAGIDRAIPSSRRIDRYLRAHDPDVVLVTPLVDLGSPQGEFVKSAQKLGIRTGVCVASWDNLSLKGLMRYVPDRVLVWNDIQRREAAEMHGIPPDRVVLTGAQRFDEWFERRPSTSGEEFCSRVGLAGSSYLLYLCSSTFIAPDEVSFVRRWLEALRSSESETLRSIGVLIRPHPQNAAQWRGVDLSPYGDVSVWPLAGAQPDAGDARTAFFDSLAHSEAVVGINTSALIEAGIVGKSVFTVLSPEFKQEDTLHFHYLLYENGGFLHLAETLDRHLEQLAPAVSHETDDAAQTRRFVESFVRPNGLDRPAAPIVADEIETLAALPEPHPVHAGAGALALRAVLSLFAVTTWLALAVRAVYRRVVLRQFPPAKPEAA